MSSERKPAPSLAARVLLVEDDAIIALSEERVLAELGYEVERASSAEEALIRVREAGGDFCVVLMDVDLGKGMDGIAAAFELRKSCPVPIVFLSSKTEAEVAVKAAGLGSSWGYFPKGLGLGYFSPGGSAVSALDGIIRDFAISKSLSSEERPG
jgi:CheY-like chemotaxis protein